MKVVMCWGGVSGYMSACWRELAARPDVDLLVFTFAGQSNTAFDHQLMAGIKHRTLAPDDAGALPKLRALILEHGAQVVTVPGWIHPIYRQLARDPALAKLPLVMTMDTPLLRSWRQKLARFKLRSYLARMSRVVVPGERSWQYARFLGVPESRIRRGVYGIDFTGLSPLLAQRAAHPWPKRFLFAGRYVPEKGLDILLAAYAQYRQRVSDPWPLTCCGMGPLVGELSRVPGVEDAGFQQPAELAQMMIRSGVFVLASRFDPWPLVVVEASAAGLPVICTEACGSAVEVVRGHYSGLTVATQDADAVARGLLWVDRRYTELPAMGARAQQSAAAYSAQVWADRWENLLGEVVK